MTGAGGTGPEFAFLEDDHAANGRAWEGKRGVFEFCVLEREICV